MTAAPDIPLAQTSAGSAAAAAPEGWEAVRRMEDIQFAPVAVPPAQPPPELSAFERFLQGLFELIGQILAPVGQWLGAWWGVIQWVAIGALAAFVIVLLVRTLRPLAGRRSKQGNSADGQAWRPDAAASLALLEDAERLAASGRFEEATRLLLTRSVGQIAAARPDWVEPSSTARELAMLPALPPLAREAFRVIAERVEVSLFALQRLDRTDWEAARDAYARFALALPEGTGRA